MFVSRRITSWIALSMAMLFACVDRGSASECDGSSFAKSAQVILATYHVSGPFVIRPDKRQGLTYELADLLTARACGEYEFAVLPLERRQLNVYLASGEKLVVPWVHPDWFRDGQRRIYGWTDGYMEDQNSLVSMADTPFEYTGPPSLDGKIVTGLSKGRWVGVDERVAAGHVTRKDERSYWLAIRNVYLGDADVALIPAPVARYLLIQHGLSGKLHFSRRPHSRYSRHFLVTEDERVRRFLQRMANQLPYDPEWLAMLRSYGL